MTIGSSPALSAVSNIARGGVTKIGLNDSDVRYLLGITSGAINLGSARGKPNSGTRFFGTPGNYDWLVVPYQNLSVDVRGGGGGGGGGSTAFIYWYTGSAGAAGQTSTFGSSVISVSIPGPFGFPIVVQQYVSDAVIANGGNGGNVTPNCRAPGRASSGGGSGGTVTVGGANNGGAGGAGNGTDASCGGGHGGRVIRSWVYKKSSNYPLWNTHISISVGPGGAGGGQSGQGGGPGGAGGPGSVGIAWS